MTDKKFDSISDFDSESDDEWVPSKYDVIESTDSDYEESPYLDDDRSSSARKRSLMKRSPAVSSTSSDENESSGPSTKRYFSQSFQNKLYNKFRRIVSTSLTDNVITFQGNETESVASLPQEKDGDSANSEEL